MCVGFAPNVCTASQGTAALCIYYSCVGLVTGGVDMRGSTEWCSADTGTLGLLDLGDNLGNHIQQCCLRSNNAMALERDVLLAFLLSLPFFLTVSSYNFWMAHFLQSLYILRVRSVKHRIVNISLDQHCTWHHHNRPQFSYPKSWLILHTLPFLCCLHHVD